MRLLLSFRWAFCLVKAAVEKIDLRLDNQIGIAFLNANMLLIMSDDEATLLVLDKDNFDNLSKFKYDDLNVLMLKPVAIDIKSKTN